MNPASMREALAPLQHMVVSQAVWHLPEYVHLTPPGWMVVPRLLVVGMAGLLLWAFAGRASALELVLAFAALVLGALLVLGLRRRRSLPLGEGSLRADQGRGCCIDLSQRCVSTQGVEPAQQWVLDAPQAWSVGVVGFSDRPRMRYGWRIELRHMRKGPVVNVCTVLHTGHAVDEQQALDVLAQTMAIRLGIRQSGARSQSALYPQ